MKTLSVAVLLAFLAGCAPTVQLAAPKEPIEINLNVKIQHEIRIKVDKELEDMFEEDSDIF
ncbi:MAG: YnbE family lipoprotein [Woeseiaceae bacterium]